jgi:hypothetical protein
MNPLNSAVALSALLLLLTTAIFIAWHENTGKILFYGPKK